MNCSHPIRPSTSRTTESEALKKWTDKQTVEKLKAVLNHDPCYGVRIEASKALSAIHTDEAFWALVASTHQSDARVRLQVTQDLGWFYREESLVETKKILNREKIRRLKYC